MPKMKKSIYAAAIALGLMASSCNDFLDNPRPQGTLDEGQVLNPAYVDNLVISAYAIWISAEDINSSFSMWNYDVRSDDAYKGGNGTEDGDVFHALEISQGNNDHRLEHLRYVAATLQRHFASEFSSRSAR